MSADLLVKAASEIAAQSVGPASSTFNAFDGAVEEHLGRIDEISTLIDSVRLEIQHAADTAFPMLLQNTQVRFALQCVEMSWLHANAYKARRAADLSSHRPFTVNNGSAPMM